MFGKITLSAAIAIFAAICALSNRSVLAQEVQSCANLDETKTSLEEAVRCLKELTLQDRLPKRAIVAVASNDGCPPGWTKFSQADGKFIVGVDEEHKFEVLGGNSKVQLTKDQLPATPVHISFGTLAGGSGGACGVRMECGQNFTPGSDVSDNLGKGAAIDISPPFLPLFLCIANDKK